MNGFIEWLEKLNEKDSRARAVLRRSLAFVPGEYPPAYPYIEPFISDADSFWRRQALYLVAGLWAMHYREGRNGPMVSLGRACAIYQFGKESSSTERRFISLLSAEAEQLPYHLRQMVALLKEQPIDFNDLLKRLLYWNDEQKRSQNAWARDYYRILNVEMEVEQHTQKEMSE